MSKEFDGLQHWGASFLSGLLCQDRFPKTKITTIIQIIIYFFYLTGIPTNC